jgi:hypothetical protein
MVGNGPFLRFTARKLDSGGQPTGPTADIGDTLSISGAAGDQIELTVDVQAPEWFQFDRVEIYTYTTGREAVNGESNSTWPEDRILDKHVLDPAQLPLEAVPGTNGVNLRRVHVTEKFTVKPAKDTWYVAMVRSTGGRTLFPLVAARPAAWSNAILVDADGSGKYDDFPLKLSQGLKVPQHVKPLITHVPSADELRAAIAKIISHHHE